MSGRAARRAAVALALAAAASTALAADEPRRTYLRRCQDQDGPAPRLLEDLDDALARGGAAGEVAYLLDRLLEEAAAPAARGVVVEVTPERFVGLRAHVLARCAALPAATLDALRQVQTRAAAGLARSADASAVLLRYPYSDAGAEAARLLAARAIASGDLAAARAFVAALERLHPDRPAPPERAALQVLAEAAARAAPSIDAPPPGPPAPRWTASLGQVDDPALEACLVHPTYARTAAGERVVASNGARVVFIDPADGAVVGRVPLAPDAGGQPPDPLTRFAARVAVCDDVAFTPLVLERWLAPARGEPAGDFAGRFYSLVALDAERARLLWWDGDRGPRAGAADGDPTRPRPPVPPPGLLDAPPALVTALAAAHVLAVAADGARVYVALLPKDHEPELSLYAYERAGGAGQPLVLRPAWAAPVPLLAAERPARVSPDDEPVAPELAAALALDGAGRLVVTTDVGVAACVDAATGDVRWLVRPEPELPDRRARMRQFGRARAVVALAPPGPAHFVEHRDGRRAVVIAGDDVLCVRLDDGVPAWSAARGRADRVLVASDHVVAYGGQELLIVDAATGAPRHRGIAEETVCGEGAAVGRTLLLPVRDGAGAKLRRIDLQVDGDQVTPRRSALLALTDHAPPINLGLSPRGLLVASGRTISLHAWEP